jgi:hypothetical protein
MEKYYCSCCKYLTSTNYCMSRHEKSAKHKKILAIYGSTKSVIRKTKTFTCKYCEREFVESKTKWRHEQKCKIESISAENTENVGNDNHTATTTIAENNQPEAAIYNSLGRDDLIKILLENQQNQINSQTELINKLVTSNAVISETSITKTADVASKSMGILKYATIHMADAPPLDSINEEEAISILNYKGNDENLSKEQKEKINESYVNTIIAHYDNKNLANLLSDMIVAYFRKPDENVKKMSSIWAVDVARLSFIIMQTINKNGDKQWRDDKTGKLFKSMVIQPMLKSLNNILKKYLKYKEEWQKNNENICTDEMSKIMNLRQNCVELMKDIRYGRLENPLLKGVAPSFQFNDFVKNYEK